MRQVVLLKFSNPEMARLLLSTREKTLVEGNSHNDRFWGAVRGHGRNELGKALMAVRHNLQQLRGLTLSHK